VSACLHQEGWIIAAALASPGASLTPAIMTFRVLTLHLFNQLSTPWSALFSYRDELTKEQLPKFRPYI
jgi:hypothetical protein